MSDLSPDLDPDLRRALADLADARGLAEPGDRDLTPEAAQRLLAAEAAPVHEHAHRLALRHDDLLRRLGQ
ncbi:hypothetical protein [Streptomyces sp. NPDC090025]|uniref:hypothetical protein n=1 Tax=Streptomyces sp. NPDC090025 TaxID=3365922 RepID=UPI003832BABB